MPNFANAKIYCIRSHQTQQIYIGSTTQPLYKRFSKHKTMYCSSKEIMKYPDCYIELLENYACADKNELNRREGQLIRLHNCINKNIAGRTPIEWREEHKDELKQSRDEHKDEKQQYDIQYRTDNKQIRNEKQNKPNICTCGSHYTQSNKQQHFKTHKHKEFIRQLSA
jgi:hypothetical protein